VNPAVRAREPSSSRSLQPHLSQQFPDPRLSAQRRQNWPAKHWVKLPKSRELQYTEVLQDTARPRLAFRIGITGKRTLSAADAASVRRRISEALTVVKTTLLGELNIAADVYSADPPLLRVVSALAEGTDRIFADAADQLEYQLQAVLPYHRDEYKKDFADADSRQEFGRLLNKAVAIFEIEGEIDPAAKYPHHPGAAYETAGRVVLDHSDLLFAVWDGKPAQGRGGTAQIIELARARGIPVVCFGVEGFSDTFFGRTYDDGLPIGNPPRYEDAIARAVRPPWLPLYKKHKRQVPEARGDYTERYLHPWTLGPVWSNFIAAVSDGTHVHKKRGKPLTHGEFTCLYQRMDAFAGHYLGRYRGAFLVNYGLGVAAVFFALLRAPEHAPRFWGYLELGAILIVLALIAAIRTQRWHYRAVDCRYFAEQLRLLCYLYPLGMTAPLVRISAHNWHDGIQDAWMEWRLRALLRHQKMPTRYLTRGEARTYYQHAIKNMILGQLTYHDNTQRLLETIEHRLHRFVWLFFGFAAIACVLHFFFHDFLLTIGAAGLPAAAAACHAITTQGEFRRLAERSGAMKRGLRAISRRLRSAYRSNTLTPGLLRRECENLATIMIDEVADWQILYRKPVSPP
jgi:hypothetical protein